MFLKWIVLFRKMLSHNCDSLCKQTFRSCVISIRMHTKRAFVHSFDSISDTLKCGTYCWSHLINVKPYKDPKKWNEVTSASHVLINLKYCLTIIGSLDSLLLTANRKGALKISWKSWPYLPSMPRLIELSSLKNRWFKISLINIRFVYDCKDVQFLCIYNNIIDFINFKLISDLLLYNALFYTWLL